jgi:pimeloyl-ACP methyl ester carboxylesterase
MVHSGSAGVVFAVAVATLAAQDTGRAAAAVPRFEVAPCPFPADDTVLKHVRCGYLEILENRAKPDGRRLKLAVAILKSLGPNPRPDPVVVLSGGPGEAFVGRAPTFIADGSMDVLRGDRDIILYDQRGVAFSEPKFCPELAEEWAPGGFETLAEYRAHQSDMAARCGESMRRAGYDLSQYNTIVSAHDLQDLRRALGVASWHLHGRSYGSRLALIAMRESPEGIRSVVIDGPLPPNRSKWFNMPGDFTDVLKRLSAECAAQPDCKAAYPDIEQMFWRTLEALERDPFSRQPARSGNTRAVRVTPARFAAGVYTALERLQTGVPMLIHGMHARDENVLTPVIRALTEAQQLANAAGSPGMMHTVNCFDEAPLATPELLQQTRKAYAPVLTDEGVFGGRPDGCDALHPYRARPDQLVAVKSRIPTLIITGEFDLQTHRSNGPLVAKTLKNSQLVDVPGVAHVPSFKYDCTRTMMRDFHNAPMQKVDVSCLKSIPRLRFLTDVNALGK